MNSKGQNTIPDSNDFSILFDKLNEAIDEQKQFFNLDIGNNSEINNIISLFEDYQDVVVEDSYTTLTRG